MKENTNKVKVFTLEFEWNIDGSAEFEVSGVYTTKEKAEKALQAMRKKIMEEWTKDCGFDIETDESDLFECQDNEWDKYYILVVKEHELD